MRDIDLMKEDDYIEEFDFYSDDLREELVDDDEISLSEAAFMQGYDQAD